MNQALYAHMNNKRKMKKTNKQTNKSQKRAMECLRMYALRRKKKKKKKRNSIQKSRCLSFRNFLKISPI
jgi:hypothetical protein